MRVRWRAGTRFSAALIVTAVPVATAGVAPTLTPTAQTTSVASAFPSSDPSAHNALVPRATHPHRPATSLQRHLVSRLPADQDRPQVVAPQVTISGDLQLRTKKERNRKIAVSSSKGGPVFTASSLAEHDLPSAAVRAYKNAAHEVDASDAGCHLSWTLLAGIGRVESDHGRYGGSVLGSDGVPRPAIVGVALNGKGPVAAIRDTDNGRFDGDKVWDRAVGPMQFIPSTWRSAGRDGDHDGVADPNDIDDAALASASYLCHGHDLGTEAGRKAAVFSYNASDYYVALVLAFAKGYQTGVFVIPSPPPAPGAGDGATQRAKAKHAKHAEHLRALKAKQKAARLAARKARAQARAAARAAAVRAKAHVAPKPPVSKPKPKPPVSKPKPKPAPKDDYASGELSGAGTTWKVGGTVFTTASASGVAGSDLDKDGKTESLADELAGVVERSGKVTIRFQVGSSPVKVLGFTVNSLDPVPSAAPSAASAAPSPAR
jgi:membrane-bound lytic murein transglycosylase B